MESSSKFYAVNSMLICIGIDQYKDRNIQPLLYCVADCFRVERIFNVFNITNSALILTNQQATLQKIMTPLTSLPKNLTQLYLYYSSHGARIGEHSYLYTYDTQSQDIKKNSLPLTTLIKTLAKCEAQNVTLILDACQIDIPKVEYNNMTIIHPDTTITQEDTAIFQSLFTQKTLSSFSQQHHYQNSNKKRTRYQRIRQDIQIFLENNHLVHIQGKSGVGKSHFFRTLKSNEQHTLYVSLPKLNDITLAMVLTLINEEILSSPANKDKQDKDVNPERSIRFHSHRHPDSFLLIDHVDHLKTKVLEKLLTFLDELPIKK